MRRKLAVGAVVLALGLGASIAPASAASDKERCKKGGWEQLHDASGQPFKNQGKCVSYAANGGTFQEDAPTPEVINT